MIQGVERNQVVRESENQTDLTSVEEAATALTSPVQTLLHK